MPDSDNCATCWFNSKNKDEVGDDHLHDPGLDYCLIRQIAIDDPGYTYCANHPYNMSPYPFELKIDVPIGPIYRLDALYSREIWLPASDPEDVRLELLNLLEAIEDTTVTVPGDMPWDVMLVWQMGEFREQRAVPGLARIAEFSRDIAQVAHEALRKIQSKGI